MDLKALWNGTKAFFSNPWVRVPFATLNIFGDGLGAVDAGHEAVKAYNEGDRARAAVNGSAAALFLTAAGFAIANFWNPAGWVTGVAVAAGLGACALYYGYNYWADSRREAGELAAAKSLISTRLPTPRQLQDDVFRHVRDPEGNLAKLVQLYDQRKAIDQDVLAAFGKLTADQKIFLGLPDKGEGSREQLNQAIDNFISTAMQRLESDQNRNALSKDTNIQRNEKLKALASEPDCDKRKAILDTLNFGELKTLDEAIDRLPSAPGKRSQIEMQPSVAAASADRNRMALQAALSSPVEPQPSTQAHRDTADAKAGQSFVLTPT
jgi:hypothetical protein